MSFLSILSIVFFALIVMPVVIAWIYYLTTDGSVMFIRQDKVRDQRFFSHSFRRMIEKALPDAHDNILKLSREERFTDYASLRKLKSGTSEELVIVREKDFSSPDQVREYEKEIYLAGDGMFKTPDIVIRAVYAARHLCLGNRVRVVRWADAEDTLTVYDDCNLGLSATAGNAVCIGKNVAFRRLFAPVIYFGQYPEGLVDPLVGRDPFKFTLPLIAEKKDYTHVTNENITEYGTAPYSVVSSHDVTVVEDITLQGDIHTRGNVRICAGSGVLGNIFSEGSILLEKGSFVLGNIFSQGMLEVEENVLIGKKGTSVSVISRGRMTIRENTVIYGYVSNEEGGMVCPLYNRDHPQYSGSYTFAGYNKEYTDVRFPSLRAFEAADDAAFRKNECVRSAVLPEGAKAVRRSMFFACASLQEIELPDSLEAVEDYALADCAGLERMSSFANTALRRIGASGLENCGRITRLDFPASLEEIGPCGCAGMSALESVSFAEGCGLVSLDDHAFRGCGNLRTLVLPATLTHVGVSAFRGCDSLTRLTVPRRVENEPGIAELPELLPQLNVEFIE